MKDLRTLAAYALVLLLLATFVSHSWCAPKGSFQRRNWTPQAMLYLKGTRMFLLFVNHMCLKLLIRLLLFRTIFNRIRFLLFLIEGRRFVSEDRNEGDLYDTIRLESRSQNTENLSISKAAAFLLNVLQQARDEGEPY
ncbi:spexin prohormone 1-like isoform X1 [Cyprinus carpio]|uniref:Spexin prohormone 1-like isoform X1 n=1 Tax=Cyprinus carpio TaxID=7962 RepID=A0A9Q9X756_CYPCA|nr:spexin prohormone 1-like isoform X1 [Cyprinus carpio]